MSCLMVLTCIFISRHFLVCIPTTHYVYSILASHEHPYSIFSYTRDHDKRLAISRTGGPKSTDYEHIIDIIPVMMASLYCIYIYNFACYLLGLASQHVQSQITAYPQGSTSYQADDHKSANYPCSKTPSALRSCFVQRRDVIGGEL